MTTFRGLTWDHPRGREALQAASGRMAAAGPDRLEWDVHPLEGFESTPIEELAARYDVIVLDHPHLGDALAHDSLMPLDQLFDAASWAGWRDGAVGPSAASYELGGHPWALPLDAATQVVARRADLLADAPSTWDDVREVSRVAPVGVSIVGPHAYLSVCSMLVAVDAEPGTDPAVFADRAAARRVVATLADLAARAPAGTLELNPIGLLHRMTSTDDVAYVPLVYGYVTAATGDRPVTFSDAPVVRPGGRRGSTIGGTGIAVTRRTPPTAQLLAHLSWLMSDEAQRHFIPAHAGQPSQRVAWRDDAVNAASGDFYRGTLATIEEAWVRPRMAGAVRFQTAASALLRSAIRGVADVDAALDEVDARWTRLERTADAEVRA